MLLNIKKYMKKKVDSKSTMGGVLDRFCIFNFKKCDRFRYIKNGKMLIIFLCIFLM